MHVYSPSPSHEHVNLEFFVGKTAICWAAKTYSISLFFVSTIYDAQRMTHLDHWFSRHATWPRLQFQLLDKIVSVPVGLSCSYTMFLLYIIKMSFLLMLCRQTQTQTHRHTQTHTDTLER